MRQPARLDPDCAMSDESETRAGSVAAIINQPDQSPPEPAPPPPRRGPRRSGKMKGRHFGPKPVADPHSAFMPAWRTTPAMRAQMLAEIEAAGLTYCAPSCLR